MLMTNQQMDFFLKKIVDKKNIMLTITEKCNIKCAHCNKSSSPENSGEVMSKKTINYIFNQINNEWTVDIFGGEPMLYPDTAIYIAKKCHEKNIMFELLTNGFWGSDRKLIKLVKEKIKPTVINFSLDSFHNIDYKILINLVEEFKDNKDIIITFTTVIGHLHPKSDEFKKYNITNIYDPLINTGRSEKYCKYSIIRGPKIIWCGVLGFDVRVDNSLYFQCANKNGCKISNNILKENINKIYNKYVFNIPKFKISRNQIIPNIYSICEQSKLYYKWNDPTYVEKLSDEKYEKLKKNWIMDS